MIDKKSLLFREHVDRCGKKMEILKQDDSVIKLLTKIVDMNADIVKNLSNPVVCCGQQDIAED